MKKMVLVFLCIFSIGVGVWRTPRVSYAQDAGTDAQGAAPAGAAAVGGDLEPVALIGTYEIMEILYEPQYHALKDAVAQEPADRKVWVTIYKSSYALAELSNLLFSRNKETYEGTDEWKTLAKTSREVAAEVAEAAKKQDYALVRAKYEAMIQNCNTCHDKYEKGVAPVLNPWGADE